jgi:hypothetical protein
MKYANATRRVSVCFLSIFRYPTQSGCIELVRAVAATLYNSATGSRAHLFGPRQHAPPRGGVLFAAGVATRASPAKHVSVARSRYTSRL